MNSRFIYCSSEQLKNKLLQNGYELINDKKVNFKGEECWVFENCNKLIFSSEENVMLKYSSVMYF